MTHFHPNPSCSGKNKQSPKTLRRVAAADQAPQRPPRLGVVAASGWPPPPPPRTGPSRAQHHMGFCMNTQLHIIRTSCPMYSAVNSCRQASDTTAADIGGAVTCENGSTGDRRPEHMRGVGVSCLCLPHPRHDGLGVCVCVCVLCACVFRAYRGLQRPLKHHEQKLLKKVDFLQVSARPPCPPPSPGLPRFRDGFSWLLKPARLRHRSRAPLRCGVVALCRQRCAIFRAMRARPALCACTRSRCEHALHKMMRRRA